jgi:hypothetical protein
MPADCAEAHVSAIAVETGVSRRAIRRGVLSRQGTRPGVATLVAAPQSEIERFHLSLNNASSRIRGYDRPLSNMA